MQIKRMGAAIVLLGAVAAGLVAVLAGTTTATPGAGISNRGKAVALSASARGLLASFQPAAAYRLAMRNGRSFYRIESAGGDCFGTGVDEPTNVGCPRVGAPSRFPSAGLPVLDFPIAEGNAAGFRFMRFEGFATDNVETVELATADGRVIDRATVTDNVFALSVAGRLPNGTELIARAGDESVVFTRSYSRGRP